MLTKAWNLLQFPASLGGSVEIRNVFSFFFSFLTKLVRRRNDIKQFCVLNLYLLPYLAIFSVTKPLTNLRKGSKACYVITR